MKKQKKITVTLTDKAEQYFYDRMYSDTKDDGATPCSQSEMISHCLESLKDFEDATDNQLEGWLQDFGKIPNKVAKEFLSNPTKKTLEDWVNKKLKTMAFNKKQVASAAWNACINYINNGGFDNAEAESPNKEMYLRTL